MYILLPQRYRTLLEALPSASESCLAYQSQAVHTLDWWLQYVTIGLLQGVQCLACCAAACLLMGSGHVSRLPSNALLPLKFCPAWPSAVAHCVSWRIPPQVEALD